MRLNFCLKCASDIRGVGWDMVLFFKDIHIYRCPFCKSWLTCYRDGTIRY